MKKLLLSFLIAVLLLGTFSAFVGCGSEKDPDNENKPTPPEPPQKTELFNHVPSETVTNYGLFEEDQELFNIIPNAELAEEKFQTENDKGITAYYIDAMINKDGEQLRTFAYVGIPEGASAENKLPAVVLVHGGGGTAYSEWVRKWNLEGFVAIAMDTYGLVPFPNGGGSERNDEKIGHANLGITKEPDHSGHFADHAKPIRDQFAYYCCSTVIACHNYLRGLDCVDTQKIGMCGISWGGFFTSVMAATDDRLAFAIPIYGCLSLTGTAGHFGRYFESYTGARPWDDASNLANIETPILWLNDTLDPYFPPDAATRCNQLCKNGYMSILKDFSHGHCFNQPEPYAFAKSVVENDMKMVYVTKQPTADDTSAEFTVPNGTAIGYIRQFETEDEVLSSKTRWQETYLEKSVYEGQKTVTVTPQLKDTTKNFYFEVYDVNGLIISTEFVKCK